MEEKITIEGPVVLVPADEYRVLVQRVEALEEQVRKLLELQTADAFRESAPGYHVGQGVFVTRETLDAVGLTAEDFLRDLAAYLFDKEVLTLGQARTLAGLTVADFMKLFGGDDASVYNDMEEFEEDIETLRRLELLEWAEDRDDIRAMQEAEREYRAGNSVSFDELIAEIQAEAE